MDSPTDQSLIFKIDAILNGKDDLKLIKKENRKLALEFTLENNLSKFKHILSNV